MVCIQIPKVAETFLHKQLGGVVSKMCHSTPESAPERSSNLEGVDNVDHPADRSVRLRLGLETRTLNTSHIYATISSRYNLGCSSTLTRRALRISEVMDE